MHAAPPSFPPADPAACFSSRARSRPPPQIAAGEPWGDALPTRAEDGSLDAGVAAFALSYTLLVCWTLLPISLAVLVNNFMTVSARAAVEKRARLIYEAKMASQVRGARGPRGGQVAPLPLDQLAQFDPVSKFVQLPQSDQLRPCDQLPQFDR